MDYNKYGYNQEIDQISKNYIPKNQPNMIYFDWAGAALCNKELVEHSMKEFTLMNYILIHILIVQPV